MAWRCPGDKPLSQPMVARLPTHIYASPGSVTRTQIVENVSHNGKKVLTAVPVLRPFDSNAQNTDIEHGITFPTVLHQAARSETNQALGSQLTSRKIPSREVINIIYGKPGAILRDSLFCHDISTVTSMQTLPAVTLQLWIIVFYDLSGDHAKLTGLVFVRDFSPGCILK